MKRLAIILFVLCTVSASAQYKVRIVTETGCEYEASQLQHFLEMGGGLLSEKKRSHIFVGNTAYLRQHYSAKMDSLHDDGYLVCGDGKNLCLYGKGEKGTLYAVYSFLEMLGYRLYTSKALVVPNADNMILPKCNVVSNPAFSYREVAYYYPNHSQLYADWHHVHTQADRNRLFGMYVHTFGKLLPPARYFDEHPEWYSLNNGRRSRDGQLCLSNPDVLEELCQRLADTMSRRPEAKIWSVSPNDNYNACECDDCRRLDSLYGGQSGTLLWFVNQVARRFPDKTISTLAYQYSRKAPTGSIKPEPNVQIMLCPIESGRQAPIPQTDPAFKKDMEDWARLTDNIYLWDYVVQFRNFWNPFPNLHVLQPNLQFFKENGARMIFEQGTGAQNVTSWMDIRCYMIAKLMWNPYIDVDSVMADFYQGYYGEAGRYVKEIIDTMTAALIQSGQTLNIYGFPVDAVDGYLSVERFHQYDSLMSLAWQNAPKHYEGCFGVPDSALWFFNVALEFARNELAVSRDLKGYLVLDSLPSDSVSLQPVLDRIEMFAWDAYIFNVPMMMEMGINPGECVNNWKASLRKRFGDNKARHKAVTLRRPATAPYNNAGLTDGNVGILDYRYDWLGFWGDTLDAVIDLGEPQTVGEISVDFYFYPLSWIFLPQRVLFAVSNDGEHWEWRYNNTNENPEVLATPEIYTCKSVLACSIGEPSKYRYVRVVAEPLPEIPAWHRAAGQKPWIFTDEIIIK